ncbi:MAG: hypothetical protein ACKO6N_06570 [Myxococcota bacterium]
MMAEENPISQSPGVFLAAPEVLVWVEHPARRHPGRLLFTAVWIFGVSIGLLVVEQSPVLALLSLGVLGGAASPFLFPTRFRLDARGMDIQTPFRRRAYDWGRMRSWQADQNGVLVSPFRHDSALDGMRGVYLRGGDRMLVEAFLFRQLGPSRGELAKRSEPPSAIG